MRAFCISLLLAACLPGQDAGEAVPNYTFAPAAALNEARRGACLVGLGDGRALAIGGDLAGEAVATAELYTPDAGWTRVASMAVPRLEHTCTLLLDGRVMVAGGRNARGSTGAIEYYSVDTDSWQRLSSSMLARWRHSATLLADGRVLLAGGQNETRIFNTLEVVDPWFDTLSLLTTTLKTARSGHAAAPLPGGGALIVGGFNSTGYLATAELYSIAGRVDDAPSLPDGASDLSATPLVDGDILVAGGKGSLGELASAQVYSATRNSFRPVEPMPAARAGHVAIMLEGNGRVLVAGGVAAEQPVQSAWLFDAATGIWTQAGDTSGALSILSGAEIAPGKLMVLGEWPQTMSVPAVRFDRKSYTENQSVRIAFENFGAAEALVQAASFLAQPPEVERTLPTGEGLVELTQVLPETSGRRWIVTVTGAADGKPLRASFPQKSRVRLTVTPAPGSPLTFESVSFPYSLSRESNPPGLASPPNIIMRVTGTTEGSTANSFAAEFAGDQQGPSRTLVGGTYSIAVRLASLTDLYEVEGVIQRSELIVRRRAPLRLDGVPPTGNTAVGEVRRVSATVLSGLAAALPRPSGTVAISRGGYVRGDIMLRGGGTGSAFADLALGQAGSLPIEFSYSGDHNFEPISSVSPPFAIQKGNIILITLSPVKSDFAVGEKAGLDAVITHPKVLGAAPAGSVVAVTLPAGATSVPGTIGEDPQNSGTVTARVYAGSLAAGKHNVTFGFSGDANFNPRSATASIEVKRTYPELVLNPPATCGVGKSITFEVIVRPTPGLVDPRPAIGSIQLRMAGQFVRGYTLFPKGNDAAATVEVGPFTTAGIYQYLLRYTGDLAYLDVDSPVITVVVE